MRNECNEVRSLVTSGYLLITFNQVVPVSGRYVAKEFWVKNGDLPVLHTVAEELDVREHMDDALFEAPPSATAIKLARGSLAALGHHYPPHANKSGIHGTVVIEETVTKSGEVRDVHFVSGPAELRDGALKDASALHLRPAKIEGQPVDMIVDISLLFPPLS
jgi:TonB family protein